MGGYGSTIGGLAGGIGGSYFGPLGSMVGGQAGSMIGSQFDKQGSKPKNLEPFDPYARFGPQAQAIEDVLGPRMRSTTWDQVSAPGPAGNPYVGPRPEQAQAIADLQNYSRQAGPLYGQSVEQQQRTVGGGYLDPMAQAPFQRLSEARQNIARDLFGQSADVISGGAAARGSYNSSARQQQQLREGRRLYNQAAQDIAEAGWKQYGAERGLQETAAGRGQELAPALAGRIFTTGEQLRGAEQAGNLAQIQENTRRELGAMEGQLKAMGLDDQTIARALEYMKLRALQQRGQVGPTPEQEASARNAGIAPMFSGMGSLSGFGGGKGWPSIFGSGAAASGAPSASVMGSSMGYWV
jgi:hypothetical protein